MPLPVGLVSQTRRRLVTPTPPPSLSHRGAVLPQPIVLNNFSAGCLTVALATSQRFPFFPPFIALSSLRLATCIYKIYILILEAEARKLRVCRLVQRQEDFPNISVLHMGLIHINKKSVCLVRACRAFFGKTNSKSLKHPHNTLTHTHIHTSIPDLLSRLRDYTPKFHEEEEIISKDLK